MLSSFLEEVKLLRDWHCDKILCLDLKVFSILVYIFFSSAILKISTSLQWVRSAITSRLPGRIGIYTFHKAFAPDYVA